MTLRIEIPGDPQGKGRPRATRAGRIYTPAKTRSWERGASVLARGAATRARWQVAQGEPVGVSIEAVKARPQRLQRRRDPDERIVRTAKPDADNVCKAVLDALQLAGVLVDDAQVADLRVRSWYAARGESPRVEVVVWRLDEP